MKNVKFDKTTKEFQMMMDWWKLLQECYEVENEDDWDELILKISLLAAKYDFNELLTDLNVVLIDDVERRWKAKNEE